MITVDKYVLLDSTRFIKYECWIFYIMMENIFYMCILKIIRAQSYDIYNFYMIVYYFVDCKILGC